MLAELCVAQVCEPDAKVLKELRGLGFPTALVSTADRATRSSLIREDVAHHIALKNLNSPKGSWEEVSTRLR